MKKHSKTLAAFVSVALVTGVVYALIGDSATADGNGATAGTADLQLSDEEDGTYADSVTGVWNVLDMEPGGVPVGGTVWMKNLGSVSTDFMTYQAELVGGSTLPEKLRITALTHDNNSILSGGAGAPDLSVYEAPYYCAVKVSDLPELQAAIDAADPVNPSTICMDAGSPPAYVGDVVLTKPITLVSTVSPEGGAPVVISGSVDIIAPGAGLTGVRVAMGDDDEYAIRVAASNTTIDRVVVNGTGLTTASADVRGIHIVSDSGTISTIAVRNSKVEAIKNPAPGKGTYGITVSGLVDSVTIEHNTISELDDTGGGFGATGIEVVPVGIETENSPSNVSILSNRIVNMRDGLMEPGKAIVLGGATNGANTWYTNSAAVSAHQNDFVGTVVDVRVLDPQSPHVFDASHNWWGDFAPEVETAGASVTVDPYVGGPFIGLVNGTDSNSNGFADLADFAAAPITQVVPGLSAGGSAVPFYMELQLDGPTTVDDDQGTRVDFSVSIAMEQRGDGDE